MSTSFKLEILPIFNEKSISVNLEWKLLFQGPDTTSKRKTSQSKKEKSAYDNLLEQQQMILQWQLENKHKVSNDTVH